MSSKNSSEIPSSTTTTTTTTTTTATTTSGISNFTKWIKGQIFRIEKPKGNTTAKSVSTTLKKSFPSKVFATIPGSTLSSQLKLNRSLKRSKSLTAYSIFHQKDNILDNTKDDSVKKRRPKSVCADQNYWVNDEILENADLLPSALFSESDIYELSIMKNFQPPLQQKKLICLSSPTKKDCLDNTYIVRGSVEHFAYVRTLRKLSSSRIQPRPFYQAFMLKNTITKLSNTLEFPVSQQEELIRYKTMIYSLNNKKRFIDPPIDSYNSPYKSNSRMSSLSLCVNELPISDRSTISKSPYQLSKTNNNNNQISAFLTEYKNPYSPIVMNYRPSYASTKVLTIFDETLNKLVTKDLPLARRRRRLSKSSFSSNISSTNTLVRTSLSSSTSSLSSLTTLTDSADITDNNSKSTISKSSSSLTTTSITTKSINYLDSVLNRSLSNYNNNDSDEENEEDDVPLFVLKEQFKYSGRGCAFPKIKNIIGVPSIPSTEDNLISPITLAI